MNTSLCATVEEEYITVNKWNILEELKVAMLWCL